MSKQDVLDTTKARVAATNQRNENVVWNTLNDDDPLSGPVRAETRNWIRRLQARVAALEAELGGCHSGLARAEARLVETKIQRNTGAARLRSVTEYRDAEWRERKKAEDRVAELEAWQAKAREVLERAHCSGVLSPSSTTQKKMLDRRQGGVI